jgi:hypothetical protein
MKDAYYFPHDSNARHDPKICDIRSKHGAAGYGWYFMLVEMLREQDGYKLPLSKCNAYAMQMQTTGEALAEFIQDCIEAELFRSDNTRFWSESLIKRMLELDEKRENRRKAAQIRWDKYNADALHVQSYASKVKKSKVKKSKVEQNTIGTDATHPLPAVISIPLIPSHGERHITQNEIDQWQELYPGIDVMQELRMCKAWNMANSQRRKTRGAGGIDKHINAWLAKAQNSSKAERAYTDL